MLGHKVSDHSGKSLPFLLIFLLVVLKEVVVWLKNWESLSANFQAKTLRAHKSGVSLDFDDTVLHFDFLAIPLDDLGLDGLEGKESSFFEF